jgi:hypothetical protein
MEFKMNEVTGIDIADLDCIYLSYDEPNKEENWVRIKNMVPWAKRVDGIKGSDAAHKAAATASTTDRFVLIDGDNIPDEVFFNEHLVLKDNDHQGVFRWRARNYINGLMYGNGGLSVWTRDFVLSMQTHEASDGSAENDVEFCFHSDYHAMYNCYSTTYPNGNAFQAWRAGFREGVKMCLNKGTRPTVAEFRDRVHHRNLDHLTIWHNVGRDVENGIWAIAGARMGTYMTMITPTWDYRLVQDFDALEQLWNTVRDSDPEQLAGRVAEDLVTQLDLPITMMLDKESAFFKQHYRSNWHNKNVMTKEIDVIREQEGW